MQSKPPIRLYVLTALVSYVLLEAATALGLQSLRVVRPADFVRGEDYVDSHFDAVTEADRKQFLDFAYDRRLGWTIRPGRQRRDTNSAGEEYERSYRADGSREDGLPEMDVLVATYGDSFTEGAEVENGQTWQAFLGASIGYEVKNFGVSAYGIGQALLKMENHLSEGVTAPVIVLGIYESDLERVLTGFRPLLGSDRTPALGFKPYFRQSADGQVELHENPWSDSSATLSDLRELARQMIADDFWTTHGLRDGSVYPKMRITYPYFFQTLPAARAVLRDALQRRSPQQSPVGSLWDDREGRAVATYLMDRFAARASETRSLPVVLFIPSAQTLRSGRAATYASFKDSLVPRQDLIVIDVLDHPFDRRSFNIVPFGGHTSACGNQVIASLIEDEIRAAGFLD